MLEAILNGGPFMIVLVAIFFMIIFISIKKPRENEVVIWFKVWS